MLVPVLKRVDDTTGWDAQVMQDVKPIVGVQADSGAEGGDGGNQAFPVALVAHLPSGELILRDETITGDKEDPDKQKCDKPNEGGTGEGLTSMFQNILTKATLGGDNLTLKNLCSFTPGLCHVDG